MNRYTHPRLSWKKRRRKKGREVNKLTKGCSVSRKRSKETAGRTIYYIKMDKVWRNIIFLDVFYTLYSINFNWKDNIIISG